MGAENELDPTDGFADVARPSEPEKRLMAAVLQTVVDDCRGTERRRAVGHVAPRNSPSRLQALAYVASRDTSWPFSFENLCIALDIEPHRMRRMLHVSPATHASPLRSRRRPPVSRPAPAGPPALPVAIASVRRASVPSPERSGPAEHPGRAHAAPGAQPPARRAASA